MDTKPGLELEALESYIAKVLPMQNPLGHFVHNNLLMAFEEQEFWAGVEEASNLYEARPVWGIERLRSIPHTGRAS